MAEIGLSTADRSIRLCLHSCLRQSGAHLSDGETVAKMGHPAEAGLVEVSLPLDLAAEVADGGLRAGLDEEAEGGVDDGLLGGGSGVLHGSVEERVVDLDVGAHVPLLM